jgi:hypothetical protein
MRKILLTAAGLLGASIATARRNPATLFSIV